MEIWQVDSDGRGGYIIYPAYITGVGLLIAILYGVFATIVSGYSGAVLNFANSYSHIVLPILFIISVIFGIVINKFCKRGLQRKSIIVLMTLAVFQILSLCYAALIYWLESLLSNMSELPLVSIIMSPIFLAVFLIQVVATILPFGILLAKSSKINRHIFGAILCFVNILYLVLIAISEIGPFIYNSVS